jgi:hypothetical protein
LPRTSCAEIGANGFLATGSEWTSSTRTTVLFVLREYLRFGVERGVLHPSLGALFPVIVANPEAVLPYK